MKIAISTTFEKKTMKRNLLFSVAAVLMMSGFALAQANSVYVLRPFPGNNDGSDEGTELFGKDASVTEYYSGSNYGSSIYVNAHPTSNCNYTKGNAFVKFHMMDFPNVTTIDSAFVGFTHTDHTTYCYSNCYAEFYFSYIDSEWSETAVTFNNQPLKGDVFYGPIPISFPNSYGQREYNITTAFYNWYRGLKANNGFMIHSESVGCNNAAVGFNAYSSDEADVNKRPYLKLYYRTAPVGMKENLNLIQNVNVFPNPANENVHISFNYRDAKKVNLELYDLAGRKVKDYGVHSAVELDFYEISVPVDDLEAGVYSLKINSVATYKNTKIIIR